MLFKPPYKSRRGRQATSRACDRLIEFASANGMRFRKQLSGTTETIYLRLELRDGSRRHYRISTHMPGQECRPDTLHLVIPEAPTNAQLQASLQPLFEDLERWANGLVEKAK